MFFLNTKCNVHTHTIFRITNLNLDFYITVNVLVLTFYLFLMIKKTSFIITFGFKKQCLEINLKFYPGLHSRARSISSMNCIIGLNIKVIFFGSGSQTSLLSPMVCPFS